MRLIRYVFLFTLLLLGAIILRRSLPLLPTNDTGTETSDNVQGEMTEQHEYLDLQNGDHIVRVRWFKVDDTSNLKLIPNYDAFKPSADVMEANGCTKMTNGGFYSTDNKPLGLVVADRKQVFPYMKSSLMNGIISVNDFGTPRITRTVPSGLLEQGVQSGPLLWENGSMQPLKLNNDKNSRRVLAVVNGSNELYFFVFYDTESAFKGPLLADLPGLVREINDKMGLNIADAINLDGGAASVFIDGEVSLSELSPVGSFWCVK